MLRFEALSWFAESAAMDENRADTPEQAIEFAPKGGPRSYAPLIAPRSANATEQTSLPKTPSYDKC